MDGVHGFHVFRGCRIAIAVVKDAAQALSDMKMLFVFPIFPFFLGCGIVVWFIAISLYLFSVGTYDQVCVTQSHMYDDDDE